MNKIAFVGPARQIVLSSLKVFKVHCHRRSLIVGFRVHTCECLVQLTLCTIHELRRRQQQNLREHFDVVVRRRTRRIYRFSKRPHNPKIHRTRSRSLLCELLAHRLQSQTMNCWCARLCANVFAGIIKWRVAYMFVALTNHLLQSACNRLQSVCAGVVTRVCVISIYSSTISHILNALFMCTYSARWVLTSSRV